ncbi:MAG: heat-inducible transcriptional repressor HrcA [Armatimonadetes bacterium]|nr:heat-inducible transcriptional repressor HrcA [Armatimonadota bacterium]MCX7967862.1 heat-inducible transcriptional repressor HrcA [Armatimonadota bacterium]MDW8142493.1 heat-inducible transcriptional repressor HrcA [Armatimonadota bacterium]
MSLRKKPILTERRKQILGAVVDLHVKTAQPVGSKAIVLEYRLNISPATVRLEFGVLEQMGLIFQPHTSAGRVPSDSGYRVFVDEVLRVRPLPPHKLRLWEQRLAQRYSEARDLLQAACRLLSQYTDYASWAILPRRETEVVRGVHFSVLPDRRVVAILLGHRLIHKAFVVSETFEPNQWQQAANWLNNRLNQVPLSTLLQTDWSHWETVETHHNPIFPLAFKLVQNLAEEVWQSEVWMEGLSRLLAEPEFQNLERAQRLIAFWETPQKLAVLCESFMNKITHPIPKAWVAIGSEIPFSELCDCSIVAAPCFAGDYPFGMIGILGPKRMRYSAAIPTVEGIANLASQALTAMLS